MTSKKYDITQAMLKKHALSIHVGAIVQVKHFNHRDMTVDVQPLSQHLMGREYQSPPPIQRLPCTGVRCGKFVLRPWYEPGDVGAILYMDHDIDKVVASGREAKPNTERNHSASDAVFVGGIVPWNNNIASFNNVPEGLALGTADGKQWLVIHEGGIESQADLWKHKGPVKIDGDVRITGNLTVEKDVTVTEHVRVNRGNITVNTGNITVKAGEVTAKTTPLSSHIHSVVCPACGAPTTGGPIP